MLPSDIRCYRFGRFLVDVEKRTLFVDSVTADIGDKTFETLLTLIERREKPISREELMTILWPHGMVGDNNLDKHISQLRRVFNDRLHHRHRHIKTIPRFGFQFMVNVEEITASEADKTERAAEDGEPDEKNSAALSAEDTTAATISESAHTDEIREGGNIGKSRRLLWIGLSITIGLGILGAATGLFIKSRLFKKPEISAIIPATPLATIGDQSIVLIGRNFHKDSTVKITFPSGGSTILEGNQIQPGTETSMVILVDFNGNWGTYTLEVNSPYRPTSAPFSFKALKRIQSPTIEAIMPESPEATKQEQSAVVYGHNFGVGVIIEVTFPDGRAAYLQGAQIPQRMPTALTMRILFDGRPGIYSIRARNPNGDWSPSFAFTAR